MSYCVCENTRLNGLEKSMAPFEMATIRFLWFWFKVLSAQGTAAAER